MIFDDADDADMQITLSSPSLLCKLYDAHFVLKTSKAELSGLISTNQGSWIDGIPMKY